MQLRVPPGVRRLSDPQRCDLSGLTSAVQRRARRSQPSRPPFAASQPDKKPFGAPTGPHLPLQRLTGHLGGETASSGGAAAGPPRPLGRDGGARAGRPLEWPPVSGQRSAESAMRRSGSAGRPALHGRPEVKNAVHLMSPVDGRRGAHPTITADCSGAARCEPARQTGWRRRLGGSWCSSDAAGSCREREQHT